jgi:nitrate/nitrite transporter NarK
MLPWIGAALGAAVGGALTDRASERFGFRWGYRLVPLISLPMAALLLLGTVSVATPWTAVLALGLAFACIEVNEGAYWAAVMQVARSDTAAAAGVLNTGGNVGGVVCQPVVAYLSGAGGWDVAFATGAVMASVAAALWLFVETQPLREESLGAEALL